MAHLGGGIILKLERINSLIWLSATQGSEYLAGKPYSYCCMHRDPKGCCKQASPSPRFTVAILRPKSYYRQNAAHSIHKHPPSVNMICKTVTHLSSYCIYDTKYIGKENTKAMEINKISQSISADGCNQSLTLLYLRLNGLGLQNHVFQKRGKTYQYD